MTTPPAVGALRGERVELVPLRAEFAAELAATAAIDRATYGYTEVPRDEASMRTYIDKLLAQRAHGAAVPFAQRLVEGGRLVGCTRLMELRWWRGRAAPDEVEIGGTWLSADTQRSGVNADAKLLLLTLAFETWGVVRVALCTDERNERSRQAIARLGASFEGILRNHRPSHVAGEQGRPRNSALFAITDTGWPAVRSGLLERRRR